MHYSPGSKTRIENAVGFLNLMVLPDYDDFSRKQTDLRCAFHLACSLFHLRDWVQSDYGLVKGWADTGQLQRFLESRCTEFALIRDIANSSKHLKLDNHSTPVSMASAVFATITPQATNALYDSSRRYQGGSEVLVNADSGDPVRFTIVAQGALEMWKRLFREEGWDSLI
jgi:hypothetical protein